MKSFKNEYKFNNVIIDKNKEFGGTVDLEPRVAKIEVRIENINKRLEKIDIDIRDVRTKVRTIFYWILGIFIPLFVSGTAATILTVLFKS